MFRVILLLTALAKLYSVEYDRVTTVARDYVQVQYYVETADKSAIKLVFKNRNPIAVRVTYVLCNMAQESDLYEITLWNNDETIVEKHILGGFFYPSVRIKSVTRL